MARARPRKLASGVEVSSALIHRDAARRLVLRLKYGGCRDSAEVLSAMMAPLVPRSARILVPIPRIYYRRVKFGSDPALLLASALARRCQMPVSRVLSPRVLGSANAGLARSARKVRFRSRCTSLQGVVLVDDVITTGMTLHTAVQTLGGGGVVAAVTATSSI